MRYKRLNLSCAEIACVTPEETGLVVSPQVELPPLASAPCECPHCLSPQALTRSVPPATVTTVTTPSSGLYPQGSMLPVVKPLFNNPFVGSDVLSEQLLHEWEQTYGDALSPPRALGTTQLSCDGTTCYCGHAQTT